MTDVLKIVEAFGRGLSSGLVGTPPPISAERAQKPPKRPPHKELPGQLPLPFMPPPGPLPDSLHVAEHNLAQPFAPGAGETDMPPVLTQEMVEKMEAVLQGRVAPDTYVPDNVDMERKVGL